MMRIGFMRMACYTAILFIFIGAFAQPGTAPSGEGKTQAIGEKFGQWALETLDSMTLDEKIGQLFMIAAYSNKDEAHAAAIERLVRDQHIGGLIFMQGGPGRQVNLINRFNRVAKIPLLISQDSEWGLSMRLDSTVRFPRNMTLGAIQDSMLIFEFGMEVGRQCRRVGVQVNFAPVVDVNNNPANPVINDRSFGENPRNVAVKGKYFFKGMEMGGAIACAKHFPGHGDTDTDSHKDLPIINHSYQRLDSIEFYPFRELIKAGVPSVMVAHLYIPALDNTPNLATTLSPKIVTDLLRDKMGFQGLSFTDALGMKGVAKFFAEGEVDLKAFEAGNDVLLFSGDVPKAAKMIKDAIKAGKISEQELDRRVVKILVAKEWAGLHHISQTASLGTGSMILPEAQVLEKRLFQAAITIPTNKQSVLPFKNLQYKRLAVIEVGNGGSEFSQTLQKYTDFSTHTLPANPEAGARAALVKKLAGATTVVIGVDGMSRYLGRGFGISEGTKALVKELKTAGKQVVVVLFGSPYSLKYFGAEDALVVAYEDAPEAKIAAAEALFGGIPVNGKLPVTANKTFKEGQGESIAFGNRLEFDLPEAAGMDSKVLERIDSVAQSAIAAGAMPGCAILVARGNKVVMAKGYGKTEYQGGTPIDPMTTLYDLASVTKVAATTVTVMKLVEEGKLNPEESVAAYLSDFRGRNLSHIKIKNLLLHNSGFKSWIPFYASTYDPVDKTKLDSTIYSMQPDTTFCVRVVDGLYICQQYQDTIWAKIIDSKVKTDGQMRYSDLNMIVMRKVIEEITGTTLDQYVDSVFYKPMGMNRTAFNPSINLPGMTCAPTEMDNYWRKKKIQGYVHDQAAAMLGGVSGHAGLFSNVYDLAKLLYMVKNGGTYGDQTYFSPQLVEQFTQKQVAGNRKALGWDRPAPGANGNPCGELVSPKTFGHTGFTGIGAWVDPEYDLIYIFLSNRTFPDANNKKLISLNVRPAIQDICYQSIFSYEQKKRP